MARHLEYVIMGPPAEGESELPSRPRQSLSVRRDPKHVTNLRTLYRNSSSQTQLDAFDTSKESSTVTPTTVQLPPTPPTVENQHDEIHTDSPVLMENAKAPSTAATPVNQHSPPTPENTPPRRELLLPVRPFLALQPSLASTRAESFRTAREHVYSDDESEISLPRMRGMPYKMSPSFNATSGETHGPAHLYRLQTPETPGASSLVDEVLPSSATLTQPLPEVFQYLVTSTPPPVLKEFSPLAAKDNHTSAMLSEQLESTAKSSQSRDTVLKHPAQSNEDSPKVDLRRDKSLRERLEEAKQVRPTQSTDKFASIIGWTNDVHTDEESGNKRWSGVSTTSTIEAFVIESPPRFQRKRGTLRHVGKNPSLRSASSPIPHSNRSSLQSTSDSPHRLVHKKAKLTNQNRWSDGSDFSRSFSVGSSSAFVRPEIIKVAVIPERSSSLHSSANNSRRHSVSNSGGSASKNNGNLSTSQASGPNRKRTISEATDRSRDRKYPPQVPPTVPVRSSSRSAPTSQTTSRANSITSEHFTVQRKQAEKDLRQTLDRMESERLVSSASGTPPAKASLEINRVVKLEESSPHGQSLSNAIPDHTIDRRQSDTRKASIESPEWTNLRPPTMLGTPFSAPSFMTGSPEIVEATAVNLFPHNNKSVQLIEPNLLTESQAVRELRQQHAAQFQDLPTLDVKDVPTQTMANDSAYTDSPLRNPRSAPRPPNRSGLSSALVENGNANGVLRANSTPTKRLGSSSKRPTLDSRARSDSFAKNLIRNFSTRQAKNPKVGQDIDNSSHPLWRPGAFWDDENQQNAEQHRTEQERNQERSLTVRNSLGLPQQTSFIIGPTSLLRRLSNAARGYYTPNRVPDLHRQTSMNSIDRLRATRKLYRSPTTSLTMHFTKLRGMQDKLIRAKSKKEEERAEKRRDLIRKSIGPNVTPKSDSRFPASTTFGDSDNTVEMALRNRDQRI